MINYVRNIYIVPGFFFQAAAAGNSPSHRRRRVFVIHGDDQEIVDCAAKLSANAQLWEARLADDRVKNLASATAMMRQKLILSYVSVCTLSTTGARQIHIVTSPRFPLTSGIRCRSDRVPILFIRRKV